MPLVTAFDVGRIEPNIRGGGVGRSLPCVSSTVAPSDSQILETWLALVRSMPSVAATLDAHLVDTPLVILSGIAAIMALSTRE